MTQSPPPQSPQAQSPPAQSPRAQSPPAQSPPAESPPAENTLEVDVSIWTLLRYVCYEGYPTDIIGFVQEAPPDDNESAYNEL